jgi:DNA repair ATPase RecN
MKKQFKTPTIAKKKGFDKVKKALRKFLNELKPKDQEEPLVFFYHSNYDYPEGNQAIMYVSTEGVSNDWAKWFKIEKTSNEFATGICYFNKKSKVLTAEIQLGKGYKEDTKKAIEKLLKPFATLKVVGKLDIKSLILDSLATDDSEPTDDYDTTQLSTYIKKAKIHVSTVLANQKELNTLVETLEPQIKKISDIIITNDLIQYSKKALVTFEEIDISDIKQEARAFKSLVPKKLIKENAELNTEIKNLDELMDTLNKLKPRIAKLTRKCLRIQKVGNPAESAAAPISTNVFEIFGTRLNKVLKSSKLNQI